MQQRHAEYYINITSKAFHVVDYQIQLPVRMKIIRNHQGIYQWKNLPLQVECPSGNLQGQAIKRLRDLIQRFNMNSVRLASRSNLSFFRIR
jgi:sulfite reductase beta subunit-like hemoprotein